MKRCPECRRDYFNDTLLYCLDDGNALLEGPASDDDQATAILHDTEPPSEAATRAQIHTTAADKGVHRDHSKTLSKRTGFSANRATKPVVIVGLATVLVVIGFLSYRYILSDGHQIDSIAVMPFVNESGIADIEYLSDGITETLISSLSQLPKLNVKARSSVFRYKGKAIDAKTLAKELNVQAILQGRVVQRGQDLILNIELIDASTDNALWSHNYSLRLGDLVALQNEVARDVTNKLQIRLTAGDTQKLTKNHTQNAEAYQLYLRGRFHWNKRMPNDLRRATEYFEQAIAIDQNYALAYTGLADALALLSGFTVLPAHEAMPKAKEAALKALTLDEELAEAHTSLGLILKDYEYDFVGAEREFKRAVELDPKYATAHLWHSEVLSHRGRHDEALAKARRTLEIDPLSPVFNSWYGASLYYARKYDEAIAQFKKTLELDPHFPGAHLRLAFIYQLKADHSMSNEEYAKFYELIDRRETAALIRESFAKGGWDGYLRAMTMEPRPTGVHLFEVAVFSATRGEKEQAIAALNRLYDDRNHTLVYLKVEPRLEPLSDDPRFKDLLKRMNLPE